MPTGVYPHQLKGRSLVPPEILKAQVLAAALVLIAEGKRVRNVGLREHGCRGGNELLVRTRNALVAEGLLPPEAAQSTGSQPEPPPIVVTPPPPKRQPPRPRPRQSLTRRCVAEYGLERMRRQYRRTPCPS